MTVIKGKTDQIKNGGPSIPDFLRVEPDEQMKRLQEVKGKLVSALQPTPEMISKLGKDPTLLSGASSNIFSFSISRDFFYLTT